MISLFRRMQAQLRPLNALVVLAVAGAAIASAQSPTPIMKFTPAIDGNNCQTASLDRSPLYNCASAEYALYESVSGTTVPMPAGTTSNLTASGYTDSQSPIPEWISLPSTAYISLTDPNTRVPVSNTTIKIRLLAQANPANTYTSLLSMSQQTSSGAPNNSVFTIGQKGSSWVYGRQVDPVSVAGSSAPNMATG